MRIDDVIPDVMWVFYPLATNEQLNEYTTWCIDMLGYMPYMNCSMAVFKSSEDIVLFKLSFPELI